jgi:hypothetical protein
LYVNATVGAYHFHSLVRKEAILVWHAPHVLADTNCTTVKTVHGHCIKKNAIKKNPDSGS